MDRFIRTVIAFLSGELKTTAVSPNPSSRVKNLRT